MPAAPPAGKKKRVELTAEQRKEKHQAALKRRRETDAARRTAKRANLPAAAAAAAPKPAAEVKVVRHTALLVEGLQEMFPDCVCAHFIARTLKQCPGGKKVVCSNGGSAEHQLKMKEVREAMRKDRFFNREDVELFFKDGLEYTFKCCEHFEGSEYFHESPETDDGRPVYPCMFCPMKGTAARGGAVPIPMPGSASSGHEYVDGKRVTVARIPAEYLDDLAPEEMPDLKAYLDGFPKVKYEEVTVRFTMKKTATGKWGSATIAIEDDE